MKKSKFYFFLGVLGFSRAFNVTDFLSHCVEESEEGWFECYDIEISPSDSEEFIVSTFNITDKELIYFDGGDLGVVNGHFFKQFPQARNMSFYNVTLGLNPSEEIVTNEKLELLDIRETFIYESNNTNALHSLPNLKVLLLLDCSYDHRVLDDQLFKKNPELIILGIFDGNHFIHEEENIENIDENAFKALTNLESLELIVSEMTHIPNLLLNSNQKLKHVALCGFYEEFPWELPSTIEEFELFGFTFEKLSKGDLKKLKNVRVLRLRHGNLNEIDEDAFDDLEVLEDLNLDFNNLTDFSPRLTKFNKSLKTVSLANNVDLPEPLDLSDAGLKETDDKLYVVVERYHLKQDNYSLGFPSSV